MAKFFYKGKSLYRHCLESGLSYATVFARIKNKGFSVDDAVETPRISNIIYYCSDGVPLVKKCKTKQEHNAALKRIKRDGVSVDNSLVRVDKTFRFSKYFYKGKPLKKVCEDKKHYKRALRRIEKGYSIQQAVLGNKFDLIYR